MRIEPYALRGKGASKMLVLSRKKNERIVIGDDITLVVVEICGDKVRLGIDAPKDVTVHRKEIREKIAVAARPDARKKGESPT
jgi:carbon storage regulator